MSTVIRDNGDWVKSLNIYDKNTNGLQKNMLRITSGLKVASAGDDPSTWATTQRMRKQVSSVDQAEVNVQNDSSMIKIAEAAIATTIEVIQTLKARAVNSADGHNNDDDRAIIQTEVEGLLKAIDNTAATATFNGIGLVDGSKTTEGLNFHIGGEANFSITLKLNDMSSDGLGLGALDLSTAEGAQRALGVQDSNGNWVYSTTDANGNKTYGLLDAALNKALDEQTKLGAMEERLGFARDNLNSVSTNMQAAISTLTDADTAREMSSYVKFSIQTQAAQFALAQMNQNAMTTLDLLTPVR